jgi:nucleotide-binding universal stress UspA family protein
VSASPTPPLRVLLPYDDSASAQRAVERVSALVARGVALHIHVLNVQPPLRSDVTTFVPASNVADFHREEGLKVLAPALRVLEATGVVARPHVGVGVPADVISATARELEIEMIVMGTHGRTAMAELLLGSVATSVIRQSDVPVMLIR